MSGSNAALGNEALDLDIFFEALDKALQLGSTYAEVRYHSHVGEGVLLINDNLAGGDINVEAGVAVRVVYKGALGFASTDKLDRNSVIKTVERAVASARAISNKTKDAISLSEEKLGRVSYSLKPREKFSDLSIEDKANILKEYSKNVTSEKIKIASKTFRYSDDVEEKIIVTSDGGYIESAIPRVSVFYNIAASSGDRRANKWGHIAGSGGLEVLKLQDLAESLSSDVHSLEVNLVDSEPPVKGVMDVILSPEIVGLALHESIGHPSEADRVLGREAAQAGLSYREWISGRIGSEHVTVADDPTIPNSYGYYLFDDEAVPARERILIKEGILHELLHSRITAARMGVSSNGAARAMNHRSEPIVRMANTYLKPGDMSLEELVEDVKEGVYIKTYMEWNIDEYRLVSRYVGLEAYRIRNGRLESPVRDVVLQIPTADFYTKIDGVGKDLSLYAGICGKGEPPQPLPVWMGGPHVRLREVRVG